MKNPYEILGIKENADDNEVKKAYRALVKKYHPDQYADNPLKKLAEEKLREVNEAYDEITRTRTNGQAGSSYSGSSGYSNTKSDSYSNKGNGSNQFYEIRQKINNGNLNGAEELLERISMRTAEWYYLKGLLSFKKGWYDMAFSHVQTACNMDPSNFEYRQTLNRMNGNANNYRQSSAYRGYNRNNDPDMCSICTTLYCADCCCECMGGDLISCC